MNVFYHVFEFLHVENQFRRSYLITQQWVVRLSRRCCSRMMDGVWGSLWDGSNVNVLVGWTQATGGIKDAVGNTDAETQTRGGGRISSVDCSCRRKLVTHSSWAGTEEWLMAHTAARVSQIFMMARLVESIWTDLWPLHPSLGQWWQSKLTVSNVWRKPKGGRAAIWATAHPEHLASRERRCRVCLFIQISNDRVRKLLKRRQISRSAVQTYQEAADGRFSWTQNAVLNIQKVENTENNRQMWRKGEENRPKN